MAHHIVIEFIGLLMFQMPSTPGATYDVVAPRVHRQAVGTRQISEHTILMGFSDDALVKRPRSAKLRSAKNLFTINGKEASFFVLNKDLNTIDIASGTSNAAPHKPQDYHPRLKTFCSDDPKPLKDEYAAPSDSSVHISLNGSFDLGWTDCHDGAVKTIVEMDSPGPFTITVSGKRNSVPFEFDDDAHIVIANIVLDPPKDGSEAPHFPVYYGMFRNGQKCSRSPDISWCDGQATDPNSKRNFVEFNSSIQHGVAIDCSNSTYP